LLPTDWALRFTPPCHRSETKDCVVRSSGELLATVLDLA
jgi:hypothetical protein